MQYDTKDNQEKNPKLLDLIPDDKRNLVGFFALLIKVDKRVNPHLYQTNEIQEND